MKHFYKGGTLDIVFTTPVPEAPAVRETITGFVISATIQGLVPLVEPIDEYSFRLFLSEAQSQKLVNPEVPIVITMKKDGVVKIGRNIDLVCVDPRVGVATEPLDDPTAMVLNMATGDISFELDLKQLPTSPYQMWLVANPAGTVEQFFAFLQKPASDFVGTFTAAMADKEDLSNKVVALDAESTDDEYPSAKLAFDQLALKENESNKSNDIATDKASTTKFPSVKAMVDYVATLVAGLLNLRGAFDAHLDAYPAVGGSGAEGVIMKGDAWVISVAGVLGTVAISAGDIIFALKDAPTEAADWATINTNISYVPEDAANKVTALDAESTDVEFPSAKCVFDELALKEVAANKVSAIPAEPTGDEFPDLALMQTEDGKKMDIVAAPAAANSTGKAGTIVIAGGFIYVCTATDTWQRAALVTDTWA